MGGKKTEREDLAAVGAGQNSERQLVGPIVRFALAIFFVAAALLTLIVYTVSSSRFSAESEQLREEDWTHLNDAVVQIGQTFRQAERDLHYVLDLSDLHDFVEDGLEESRERLELTLKALSENRLVYDQIRLLGLDGRELLRVNFDRKSGTARAVPTEELQNKSSRYYFDQSVGLSEGEIYVSPLDLNIENGQIEQPLKPMVRFVTPVGRGDGAGERAALLVVNMYGDVVLEQIDRLFVGHVERPLLADGDGYWLHGPSAESDWTAMLPDREYERVSSLSVGLWNSVRRFGVGRHIEDGAIYRFISMRPTAGLSGTSGSSDYVWYLIARRTGRGAADLWRSFRLDVRTQAGLYVLAFLFSLLLGGAVARRRQAERRAAGLYGVTRVINRVLRHDILSRLNGIRFGLEMDMESGHRSEYSEEAYRQAEQGIGLVRRMSLIERLASGGVPAVPVDVRQVLSEVLTSAGLPSSLDGQGTVMAGEALRPLLENIVQNAGQHSGTDRIEAEIGRAGRWVTIRVSDFGQGLPAGVGGRRFNEREAFISGDKLGLGLFIIRWVVESYGGTVSVVDSVPHGTTYLIRLRAAD
ncbi:MAG: HAMP domain-containing sensor histidine kinase [bacterium]